MLRFNYWRDGEKISLSGGPVSLFVEVWSDRKEILGSLEHLLFPLYLSLFLTWSIFYRRSDIPTDLRLYFTYMLIVFSITTLGIHANFGLQRAIGFSIGSLMIFSTLALICTFICMIVLYIFGIQFTGFLALLVFFLRILSDRIK